MIGRRSNLKCFVSALASTLIATSGPVQAQDDAVLRWSMAMPDKQLVALQRLEVPILTPSVSIVPAAISVAEQQPTEFEAPAPQEVEVVESIPELWPNVVIASAGEGYGPFQIVDAAFTPAAIPQATQPHDGPLWMVDETLQVLAEARDDEAKHQEPEALPAPVIVSGEPLLVSDEVLLAIEAGLALEEPSALQEPSALKEPSAPKEPSALEEAKPTVAAEDPTTEPWDAVDELGPVAMQGDIREIADDELPPLDPLLSEEFLVAEEVLAEAANTEYLEDLGLLDVADTGSYQAVTNEIAESGVDLIEEVESGEKAPRFDYSEQLGDAPPLTIEQVLEYALSNNPEVGAALAREEQARWLYREAQVYKYPTIDVVAEGGPEYNRTATNTSGNEDITPGRTMSFRVTQLLYDGGVSLNESDRRLQVRRSTELETRLIVEEIVTRTAEFYSQVLQFQQASRVAEEFVEEMQTIFDKLEVMYESGAASKLELDFARARLASARAETGNTKAQLNDALSNLEFLTGELDEFTAVPPQNIHDLTVDHLSDYIATGREQNALVLLNRSNKQALQYKIRAQRAQFRPVFSLNMKSEALADEGGNLDPRNTTEVKLKAEYFLFDGGARRARLNRTRAQLKELDWEDERLYKEVDRDIKQSYNQITTNRLTLDATEDEIASNRELRRLNRQNLEEGEISIIELIEVEERLFNSQSTWYRVSSEMYKNYYELLVNTGELAKLVGGEFTQTRIEEENVSQPLD